MRKEGGVAAQELTRMSTDTPTGIEDIPLTLVPFTFQKAAKRRISRLKKWEANSENVALELTGRG